MRREPEVMGMGGLDSVSCRLAIQLCVGYSEKGKARHRTININGIDPNADVSLLAAFVRDVLSPLLAYPVTKARLVTREVRVLFDAGRKNREPRGPETAAMPAGSSEHAAFEPTGHERGVTGNDMFTAFARLVRRARQLFRNEYQVASVNEPEMRGPRLIPRIWPLIRLCPELIHR
jgi:hypothetical protein